MQGNATRQAGRAVVAKAGGKTSRQSTQLTRNSYPAFLVERQEKGAANELEKWGKIRGGIWDRKALPYMGRLEDREATN